MNLTFTYDTQKDIWCLLTKGKTSNNSGKPTQVYQDLVARCGENPSEAITAQFINDFLTDQHIDIDSYIKRYTEEWQSISENFLHTAEQLFETKLPTDITAYLTINNRRPYNIAENYFFVTFPRESVRMTILHELWHFYTYYGLGADEETRLGKESYNTLKEALTVLINVTCVHLLPDGELDAGYPQHQELRGVILQLWDKHKNIQSVWRGVQTI